MSIDKFGRAPKIARLTSEEDFVSKNYLNKQLAHIVSTDPILQAPQQSSAVSENYVKQEIQDTINRQFLNKDTLNQTLLELKQSIEELEQKIPNVTEHIDRTYLTEQFAKVADKTYVEQELRALLERSDLQAAIDTRIKTALHTLQEQKQSAVDENYVQQEI